ncbi:MAG: CidA/LrgA family protein [Fusobacteriota bacterium]
MEIFMQFAIILGVLEVGKFISGNLNLPIPGSVIGMVILLLLLEFKIMKLERIQKVGNFLLDNLAFFFVPATVSVMKSYGIIKNQWWQIILICFLSTIVVFGVTGFILEKLIGRREKNV